MFAMMERVAACGSFTIPFSMRAIYYLVNAAKATASPVRTTLRLLRKTHDKATAEAVDTPRQPFYFYGIWE
jgi:hypothetical protein